MLVVSFSNILTRIVLKMQLTCFTSDRCNMPLGLGDRRIANPLITASSYHSFYCGPWNARLHQRRVSRLGGSWCARRNDPRQWLQVGKMRFLSSWSVPKGLACNKTYVYFESHKAKETSYVFLSYVFLWRKIHHKQVLLVRLN